MIKVYFTCGWDNSTSLLKNYKKNTPKCKGIWKNIEGTDDLYNCDYLIVMDNLNPELINLGKKHFLNIFNNSDNIIHFQRENENILKTEKKNWYLNEILPKLKYNITCKNKFLYSFITPSFINKTYDELKSMKYSSKTKNISCIISTKNFTHFHNQGYTKRINFIKQYSKQYKIDIYGRGWNKHILGDNYIGELGGIGEGNNPINNSDKSMGLLDYNYSIALENFNDEHLISEKITDCILCYTMPIYWGSKYTEKYIPKKSFHLIDIEDNNVFENIQNIISHPPTIEEIESLIEARNIILDKLNIWEQIYQIINNYDTFFKNYRF